MSSCLDSPPSNTGATSKYPCFCCMVVSTNPVDTVDTFPVQPKATGAEALTNPPGRTVVGKLRGGRKRESQSAVLLEGSVCRPVRLSVGSVLGQALNRSHHLFATLARHSETAGVHFGEKITSPLRETKQSWRKEDGWGNWGVGPMSEGGGWGERGGERSPWRIRFPSSLNRLLPFLPHAWMPNV